MNKGILQLAVSRNVSLELQYREFTPQLEAESYRTKDDGTERASRLHQTQHR